MKKTSIIILIILFLLICMLTGCNKSAHKIDFILDDEVLYTINTKGKEEITLPKNPEKIGYTFDGWFLDKDTWQRPFTVNSLIDVSLSENMAVYAKWTEDVSTDGIIYALQSPGDSYSVIGYTGFQPNVKISNYYNGKPVTTINSRAFDRNSIITSVSIPNSIVRILSDSFRDCSNLTSIYIPKTVKSIENEAFINCKNLVIYVEMNESIEWCKNWYGDRPVYWGITENNFLEKDGFQFVLNEGNAIITRYIGLENTITIPSTVTIGGNTISVTNIGEKAFVNSSNLTTITIPDCIINIGFYAFFNCSNLTSITIPNSVVNIYDNAFYNCNKLVIYVKATETQFTSNWSDWQGGCPVYWGITENNYIEKDGFQYILNEGNAIITRYIGINNSIKIPSTVIIGGNSVSVTSIGNRAFADCISLTSINIPISVIKINDEAFNKYNYNMINKLIIYAETTDKPINWNVFGIDWEYYCYVYWGITKNNYLEKDGLQYVLKEGNAILSRYIGLENTITIPYTITIDGNTVNVTSISDCAFSYCSKLTSITIPDSVKSIGSYAFSNCSNLLSVNVIASTPPSLGSNAFNNNASNRYFYVPSANIDEYKSAWNNYAEYIFAQK